MRRCVQGPRKTDTFMSVLLPDTKSAWNCLHLVLLKLSPIKSVARDIAIFKSQVRHYLCLIVCHIEKKLFGATENFNRMF